MNAAMGEDDSWKHCIPGAKEKPSQHFDAARSKRIVVEIDFFLHAHTSKPKATFITCCILAHAPKDVATLLESNHAASLKHNSCPYYFFDGRDHPMKAETKASTRD